LGNFNAFYVPENTRDLFSEPITPVNTFRLLFNSIFGTSYEILEDKVGLEEDEIKNWNEVKDEIINQGLN